jgi:hypothetical protein
VLLLTLHRKTPSRQGSIAKRPPLPTISSAVYSPGMKRIVLFNLLLATLIIEFVLFVFDNDIGTTRGMTWRIGFFILLPLTLAVLVWLKCRWAAMICVMYATVGLAMDVATIVHILKQDSAGGDSLIYGSVSGVFYFSLIVFGGWFFLDVSQEPMPQESRPPNPPSPS